MGRNKKFDQIKVISSISQTFIQYGYEGTSLDDLVKATGLLRGSLYATFGSKRGMFLAALEQATSTYPQSELTTNLMMIALIELTSRDIKVNQLVTDWTNNYSTDTLVTMLGHAILKHSQLKGVPHGKPSNDQKWPINHWTQGTR